MMERNKLRKIIEAAKLYYQLDYGQQEIAKKLGVSRPTVSRFLQQAKAEGIVQIKIMDPSEDSEKLSSDLEGKFHLKKALVVSIPQYEDSIVKKYLGEATAHYLYQTLKNGDMIATSWGTTLYQVAVHLQHKHVKDVTVVQLNGGVSHSETNTYASEILQLFGKCYNTIPYLLPLPAIVDHIVVKQAIEADRHIRKVLELGKQANIALFTVGVPATDSVLIQTNYFTNEDLDIIHSKAVGDICSRYIDEKGQICHENLNNRTIGIELKQFAKKEYSILVAGGAKKVDAIYGALQGGYPNTLITDQFTAKSLLAKNV
jgi:deoxyribonucleoside regulator